MFDDCSITNICRTILTSLLDSSPSCLTLMTGTKSTYVVQKLISVLPPALLEPLVSHVVSNLRELSLDSSGCHLVQVLLQAASPAQQQLLTSLLCQQEMILALAHSSCGTFVAQARSEELLLDIYLSL